MKKLKNTIELEAKVDTKEIEEATEKIGELEEALNIPTVQIKYPKDCVFNIHIHN